MQEINIESSQFWAHRPLYKGPSAQCMCIHHRPWCAWLRLILW